jgi:hypothetical protein
VLFFFFYDLQSTASPSSTNHSPMPASSPRGETTPRKITAQRSSPPPQRSVPHAQRSAPPPQPESPALDKIAPYSHACDNSEEEGHLLDENLRRMIVESKAKLNKSLNESLKALDMSKAELRRSLSPVSNISPQQAARRNALFDFSPSPSISSVSKMSNAIPCSCEWQNLSDTCFAQANHSLTILSVLDPEEAQDGGDATEQHSHCVPTHVHAVTAKVTPPGARPRYAFAGFLLDFCES